MFPILFSSMPAFDVIVSPDTPKAPIHIMLYEIFTNLMVVIYVCELEEEGFFTWEGHVPLITC